MKKFDNKNHAMYVEHMWDHWTYAVKHLEKPQYPQTAKHFKKSNGNPDVHDADSKKDAVKSAIAMGKKLGLDTLYAEMSPKRPLLQMKKF